MLQEVAAGQYLGSGGSTLIGQFVPMLKGVGYATMTIVFFLDIYYCIIIAWTLFYLINSFVSLPDLPWATCGMFSLAYVTLFKLQISKQLAILHGYLWHFCLFQTIGGTHLSASTPNTTVRRRTSSTTRSTMTPRQPWRNTGSKYADK